MIFIENCLFLGFIYYELKGILQHSALSIDSPVYMQQGFCYLVN